VLRTRGLGFAVFTTPRVPGPPPLLCVNGGLLYDHTLLWPALSPRWLDRLDDGALARLSRASREALEAAAGLMARSEDVEQYAEHYATYSRALYPAWFGDAELAAVFSPPRAASRTGAAVAARLRREGYDWRHRLADLNVATLVIHGERDLVPAGEARETAALLPQARLALIRDAGHMPFWEAPEQFFTLVEEFLTD